MGDAISRPVALVTGGAKRIGAAIVSDLCDHGWSVAIHCNTSMAEAQSLAGALRSKGAEVAIVKGDLRDIAALPQIVEEARKALGPITLLVNNAAIYLPDEFGTLDVENWSRHFAINLQAPIFLAQAFAEQLPAGDPGNIVNLIDQCVWKITPRAMSYSLTKSALLTATRMMAQAMAPRIRVNGIGPGPVFPNLVDGPEGMAIDVAKTLLKQQIDPYEIAAAVRFLVSSASLTGQMIAIDGGQHLVWGTADIVDKDR